MEMYNKHYITVDAENRITNGFSDAFRQPTEADICINEEGGYQFRLLIKFTDDKGEERTIRTEENPALHNDDGTPLYKWNGENVLYRTEEEIEADRPVAPEPAPPSDLETRISAVESDVADLTAAVEKGLSL